VALVQDTRPCAVRPVHVLRGLKRAVYAECDVAQSAGGLADKLGAPPIRIRRALDGLVKAKLMLELGGKYLSLAVFRSREAAVLTPRSSAISA
jgi:hypothetical protein